MAGRRRPQLPAIVVLTVVWALLWDHLSLFIVLTGVLLAVLIGLVFPLPPIELHGRTRPVALLQLAVRLLTDVVRSSVAVVGLAFRFGTTPRSAIIGVKLRSRSDLYLTQTAELVSLVPGSIVLEAHRSTSTLYLHVLDAVDEADLAQARQAVLDAESRVIRAFGSTEEIEALDAGLPQPGAGHGPADSADRPPVDSSGDSSADFTGQPPADTAQPPAGATGQPPADTAQPPDTAEREPEEGTRRE